MRLTIILHLIFFAIITNAQITMQFQNDTIYVLIDKKDCYRQVIVPATVVFSLTDTNNYILYNVRNFADVIKPDGDGLFLLGAWDYIQYDNFRNKEKINSLSLHLKNRKLILKNHDTKYKTGRIILTPKQPTIKKKIDLIVYIPELTETVDTNFNEPTFPCQKKFCLLYQQSKIGKAIFEKDKTDKNNNYTLFTGDLLTDTLYIYFVPKKHIKGNNINKEIIRNAKTLKYFKSDKGFRQFYLKDKK